MPSRLTAILAFLAVVFFTVDARAERRVALVIGNAQYQHAPALRNPQNDAADMAAALKKLEFEVLLGVDLDQRGFAQHVERFARMLDGADVALVYYAGHAVQINDRNFLLSTGAQLTSEFLIPSETIELDTIIRLMESKTRVNLVFLDACRNNPLVEDLRRNLVALKRSASLGRGLARVEPTGRDTLVAFAAAPGQEAADGDARNSPFTRAVLKHIGTPGQEVSVMLKEVAADVRRDTGNAQRPQQVSDMTRTFYFAKHDHVADPATPEPPRHAQTPARAPAEPAPSADDRTLDVAFWNAAQAANECEAVRAYLTRFPNGIFIELAKLSERRLCAPAARVAAAVEPPSSAQPRAPMEAAPAAPAEPAPAVSAPASAPSEPRPQVAAAPSAPAAQPTPPAKPAKDVPPAAGASSAPAAPPAPAAAPAPVVAPTPSPPAEVPPPAVRPSAPPSQVQEQPVERGPQTAAAPVKPAVQPAPSAAPPPAAGPDPELVRSVQRELVRLGCSEGEPDGLWTVRTQDAVERFNEHGRWRFDTAAPSLSLLAALSRSDARVCPLQCGEGQEARGNACVAVAPAAPPPAQETRRPRRQPAKAKAAREPRKAKARATEQKRSRESRREAERAATRERRATRREAARPRTEQQRRPTAAARQEAPYTCFTDEGGGRRRPCDAGGGR